MGRSHKQLISERTLLVWLAWTVACSVICILAGAVLVFLLYGCWPIARQQLFDGGCLSQVRPGFLVFIPAVAGIVAGTLVTRFTQTPAGE